MLAEPGSNPPPRRPPHGIYAYTAREWDPETNLYYYRARYYDPKIGRFISEDPSGLADGPNRYIYVKNEPTNLTDPTGRIAWGGGGGLTWVWAPVNWGVIFDFDCWVVGDDRGNTGLLCCGGGGLAGGTWGGLPSPQAGGMVCPSCETICDMTGLNLQFHAGAAKAGGAAGSGGATMGSRAYTFAMTAGAAAAAGAYVGFTLSGCKMVLSTKDCDECP